MAYQKIAVAGATGNVGPAIVQGLIDAGFDVTTLSTSGNTTGLPPQVKTIKVDYDSRDSLVDALKGQDAIVSAVPTHDKQPLLIDAAIAAGVKFFMPSEFGSDVAGNERIAGLPVFAGKVTTQKYLKEKSDKISYALLVTGLFLDWGLNAGFWANLKGGPTRVFNGGDSKHSTTTLADIGKAVAAILKNPESNENRSVYVQSAAVSQNQLLEIAKKIKPDFKTERYEVNADDIERGAYETLQKGGEHIRPAMIDFIAVSIFHPGFGGSNWSTKNDNTLLGIKEKSQEELEQIVAQYL